MPRCPGQDFKWYDNLLYSFLFGIVFFAFGFICGSFILLIIRSENWLFWFLIFPSLIYLIGSLFLFISVRWSQAL